MFTLLKNLRFYSEIEIRNKLKEIRSRVTRHLPIFIITRRSDRRQDIIVTYVDGAGKSEQLYANRFADENLISSKNVVEPTEVANEVRERAKSGTEIHGVVIVDDILATGQTMSQNLRAFAQMHGDLLQEKGLILMVAVVVSTVEGEEAVRCTMEELKINADLLVCERIPTKQFAFAKRPGIWGSNDEYDRARALCRDLGARIYRDSPLGYGDLGLLVVFSDGCPNNTLPIIHSGSNGPRGWRPLFPRPPG